jgi:ribosomal protein S18 acetylase RimI-like enzyme
MHTEFRRVITPKEMRSLILFDRKAFHDYPGDWFTQATWQTYESWWMILGKRKIGCCAFGLHADFQEDIHPDENNPHRRGSLYIVSTAILPQFRGKGFGTLIKAWQLSYAKHRGFRRIVTSSRKSNKTMIRLNAKFGFKIVRTAPGYYEDPPESAVVMERRLIG